MKKILFLGFLFAANLLMAAPSCTASLAQGSLAYREGNFDKAIELWQTCVEQGYQSGDLYYNLGNAYFREKHIGFAILYLESALRLDPANEDYRHNLKFVQGLTKDKIETDSPEENPILNTLFNIHHALSLRTQLYVILGLAWLILILLILRVLSANPRVKNILTGCVFPLALILGIIGLSATYKAYVMETFSKGVVTATSADVMSGPDDSYQMLNALSEGTIFEVTGIRQGWVQIRLGEKVNGFVKATEVGIIK
jgi:tetratricopeptide (TPR) repeat protein